MINLALLKRQCWRLFVENKSYQDLCEKQWTLCPSETVITPAAIYLEGELDKVSAIQEDTNYALEFKRVQGGGAEHAATTAYQINDAHISNGYVYKKSMKLRLTTNKESLFEFEKVECFPEAALASTFCGNRYFGHWLTDDLTLALSSQKMAQAVSTKKHYTSHQAEYSKILKIHPVYVANAQFKKLIITQDFGQNSYKRERYKYIRSKLQAGCSSDSKMGVMLLRGSTGVNRPLVNEKEIAEFLKSQGFIIIDPESKSASDIALLTSQARIIIGVEGSHLVHGLFTMKEGGTLLTLQPPFRFNNVFKDYTDCLELKYSFVVGKQVENGFEVDITDIVKTIDLINL
jgi:hypothetical protein